MKKYLIVNLIIVVFASIVNAQDYKFEYKTVHEKKKKYELNVRYPQITMSNPATEMKFNNLVKKTMENEMNVFKKEMKTWESPMPENKSEFEIRDTILLQTKDIVSIKFYGYDYYSGAAHPNTFFLSVNYDPLNNKELTLADIFSENYLEILSGKCIKELMSRVVDYSDSDWVNTGAGPDSKNYEIFNLSSSSILVTFPAYQVAAYVAGPQDVEIPYNELKAIIPESSPLMRLMH